MCIFRKAKVIKPVFSITPFTLLDYPGKTACIVWFAGCNMRCSYCYNPDIVLGKGSISYAEVLTFVRARMGLLDGVVLSGGECTLHYGIEEFAAEIKQAGMFIKVDTNGSKPAVIRSLIEKSLVDYIALDFKAPSASFMKVTSRRFYSQFCQTLNVLLASDIDFEVRTTVHDGLLNMADLQDMAAVLKEKQYKGTWYLQRYVNDVPVLGNPGKARNVFTANEIGTEIEICIRD